MLASEVAAERCAGTEHEHGFVQIDVCLWVVDQRVADALLVRGETIQIRKTPSSEPDEEFRLLQAPLAPDSAF